MLTWRHWHDLIERGQKQRAIIGRHIVCRSAKHLFDALDFENDEPFLEPLLVPAGLSSNPAATIPQVLVGHLWERAKALGVPCNAEFSADSNEDGFVALPRIGYLPTSVHCGRVRLFLDSNSEPHVRLLDGDPAVLDGSFQSWEHIDEFALIRHKHPLMESFTIDVHGGKSEIPRLISDSDVIEQLHRALGLISKHYPEYFEPLKITTRQFVLFSDPGINSFASEGLHGVSFLSLPPVRSVPYFVEDILHQCGHTIFGSMFFESDNLFGEKSDTPISLYNGEPRDKRSIFVICHAVFTECVITEGLLRCLEQHVFTGWEKLEAIGRLAFVLKKYLHDLQNLFLISSLMSEGIRLRTELRKSLDEQIERSLGFLPQRIDLNDQPYNFDMEIFCRRNHIDTMSH